MTFISFHGQIGFYYFQLLDIIKVTSVNVGEIYLIKWRGEEEEKLSTVKYQINQTNSCIV
jgi:hypothetical protein